MPASTNDSDPRTKLAERLHDTVCQYVSALNSETYLLSDARWKDLSGHVDRVRDLAERLALELRQILTELRPRESEDA